jgi:hypothetical protein
MLKTLYSKAFPGYFGIHLKGPDLKVIFLIKTKS